MTRDERQTICINNWLKANGRGSLECVTGFGKTRTAIKCILKVRTKYPDFSCLIVVPTMALKEQWEELLTNMNINNCNVCVINTVVKNQWKVDILILDECHRYASSTFIQVFKCVKYKLVLGLTGTMERLDGKHEILKRYCPIVDTVTISEALANGWLSKFVEYEVIINVDNIEEYKKAQHENVGHFEFFNFDYDLIMSLVGKDGYENRKKYTSSICTNPLKWNETFKEVTYHATRFMRTMQDTKLFINNHSKKIEIARKIIESRPLSKIITFSNNVKMASSIGMGGEVYTGRISKKQSRDVLKDFSEQSIGILHSCSKLNEGLDCPGLSVAIILGLDSSKIKSVQRRGRVIRAEEGKYAEIFNIVINDTKELHWFEKSHVGSDYVKIDEANLEKVLNYESFDTYKEPLKRFNYRF